MVIEGTAQPACAGSARSKLTGHRIGTYQDSNGLKVHDDAGAWVGWVYAMDYLLGCEGTWGSISVAGDDEKDRSLYREGFASRREAARWLITRWEGNVD